MECHERALQLRIENKEADSWFWNKDSKDCSIKQDVLARPGMNPGPKQASNTAALLPCP